MARLKTKVQINSTTIKDDSSGSDPKLLINWEYDKTTSNGISELNMKLLAKTSDTVTLAVGHRVEIWMGFTTSTDTKIFDGYIGEYKPEGGLVKLRCYDKMWNLIRQNINNVYLDTGSQAGQISEIAKDLIETFGELTAEVVATGTAEGETISEFRCKNTDIYERLLTLAKAVNYQIYYRADTDKVYFEPKGYTNSGQTLTVGTEIIGLPQWKKDTSQLINDLRVDGAVIETNIRKPTDASTYGVIDTTTDFDTDGILLDKTPETVELTMDSSSPPITILEGGSKDGSSGNDYYVDKENKKLIPTSSFTAGYNTIVNYTFLAPAPIHLRNEESITTYGKFEKQITLFDVISVADAEARANKILTVYSEPFLTGDLIVKLNITTIDLMIGDKVKIVDSLSKPNINTDLIISKQTLKYPGSHMELQVGDIDLRLGDWQLNVEERLKRLEERGVTDDLLLELFNFTNTVGNPTVEPRYFKILNRDTSTDTIWGRNDWGDNWDGSYDNSETTFYVHQYEDEYLEEFIDTDFKDTGNTTATWTGNGSVTF